MDDITVAAEGHFTKNLGAYDCCGAVVQTAFYLGVGEECQKSLSLVAEAVA